VLYWLVIPAFILSMFANVGDSIVAVGKKMNFDKSPNVGMKSNARFRSMVFMFRLAYGFMLTSPILLSNVSGLNPSLWKRMRSFGV
jgi:hypothetical protein